MPTAEAAVRTDRAARYLDQFCQHAGQVHRMRHRLSHGRAGATGGHLPGSGQVTVQRSDTQATIDFGWARCQLTAGNDTLTLRAEAGDEPMLQRVQDIVANDLNRFGRREQLTFTWLKVDDRPGPG